MKLWDGHTRSHTYTHAHTHSHVNIYSSHSVQIIDRSAHKCTHNAIIGKIQSDTMHDKSAPLQDRILYNVERRVNVVAVSYSKVCPPQLLMEHHTDLGVFTQEKKITKPGLGNETVIPGTRFCCPKEKYWAITTPHVHIEGDIFGFTCSLYFTLFFQWFNSMKILNYAFLLSNTFVPK